MKGRVEPFLRFFVYTIRLSFNSQSPSPIPSPLKGEGLYFMPSPLKGEGLYFILSPLKGEGLYERIV